MDIAKTEQLQGKIDNTLSQVSKAINDLRDLSKSFNTDNITAIGLVRAIESELEMIKKTDFLKQSLIVPALRENWNLKKNSSFSVLCRRHCIISSNMRELKQ
jgi:hypothetical protein